MLNEHPEVSSNGEILNPDDVTWQGENRGEMTDEDLLRLSFEAFPLRERKVRVSQGRERVRRVGVKIVQLRPYREERWSFVRAAMELRGTRAIVLRRANMLQAVRSLEQAKLTNQWVRYYNDEPVVAPVVRIDPAFARMWFEESERFYEGVVDVCARRPILELTYEDMVADVDETLKEVWEFLDVRTHRGPRDLVLKQELRSLRESITNYDELRAEFVNTPYSAYFPD